MSPPPSTLRSGSPSASKKALLLHGISSDLTSLVEISDLLVAEGWYTVAVDLRGHGNAPRVKGEGFTIAEMAGDLVPLVEELGGVDMIVAHSLGGPITLSLLQQLPPTQPLHILLIDPPLLFPGSPAMAGHILAEKSSPPSVDEMCAANPKWSRRVCEGKVEALERVDESAIKGICEQNIFDFYPLLTPLSPLVDLIILGADPISPDAFTPSEALELAKTHPGIKTAFVPGTGHSVHRDEPGIVARVALTWSLEGEGLEMARG